MINRTAIRPRAFTLIELLVVVGIIAILAAIALPNLLDAQVRAKVSRAKNDLRALNTGIVTYIVDNNTVFPDSNDSNAPADLVGLDFESENRIQTDVPLLDFSLSKFYTFRAYTPVTTPVAYLTSIPRDPFSKVMPMSYDTREVDGQIAYAASSCVGPDRVGGNWFRGYSPTNKAITYDPTNGTVSTGEIWRAMSINNPDLFRREYGAEIP